MINDYYIKSLSLAGYRSFGAEIQRFKKFSKINLFIGQNNCGKSNILKFIHEKYPRLSTSDPISLEPLDNIFIAGLCIDEENIYKQIIMKFSGIGLESEFHNTINNIFNTKKSLTTGETILKIDSIINYFGSLSK